MQFLNRPVAAIVAAFLVTIILFYFLDHATMSMQGLPLNADLTPAQ